MVNIKKGAMFGLDARIALAIYGALSVISGAALYSAIKTSKATALLTDMRETSKAWEAYLLDTGSDLPPYNTTGGINFRDMTGLVEDTGITNWKGPYTSLEKHSSYPKALKHPLFKGEVHLMSIQDSSWGGSVDWGTAICTDDKDCSLWVYIDKVTSSYHKQIDEMVDSGDGDSAGNYRWVTLSDAWDDRIFLKVGPYSRP